MIACELCSIDVENGSNAGLVGEIGPGQSDRNTSNRANELLCSNLNISEVNCGGFAGNWLGWIEFGIERDPEDGTGGWINENAAVIAGGSAIGIVDLICAGELVVRRRNGLALLGPPSMKVAPDARSCPALRQQ